MAEECSAGEWEDFSSVYSPAVHSLAHFGLDKSGVPVTLPNCTARHRVALTAVNWVVR